MALALNLLKDIRKGHERMVLLAGQLDWNGVTREWDDLSPKLVELKKLRLTQLSENERAEASELLAELITLEKQVSARITPWIEQVRPLLESFRKYPLNMGNGESR